VRSGCKVLVAKSEENRQLERHRSKCKEDSRNRRKGIDRIKLALDGDN
jgi:hypothetical protein